MFPKTLMVLYQKILIGGSKLAKNRQFPKETDKKRLTERKEAFTSEDKEKIKERSTSVINLIDRLTYKWIEHNRRHLISSISRYIGISDSLILDIGCGRWPYTASFPNNKSSCRSFLALDISREVILSAKARNPMNFHFIVADAHHIPLRDLAIQLLFSKDLLHHVQQPKWVLSEISRISRRSILIEANRPNKLNMLYTYLQGD